MNDNFWTKYLSVCPIISLSTFHSTARFLFLKFRIFTAFMIIEECYSKMMRIMEPLLKYGEGISNMLLMHWNIPSAIYPSGLTVLSFQLIFFFFKWLMRFWNNTFEFSKCDQIHPLLYSSYSLLLFFHHYVKLSSSQRTKNTGWEPAGRTALCERTYVLKMRQVRKMPTGTFHYSRRKIQSRKYRTIVVIV